MSDSSPVDGEVGGESETPGRRTGRHRQRSHRLIGVLSVLTLLVITGAAAGLMWNSDDETATESTSSQRSADSSEAGRGASREAPSSSSPSQEPTKESEKAPPKKRLNEAEQAPEPEPSEKGESKPKIPADCDGYSGNRALGCAMLEDHGFGMDQMECLDPLWDKESGWDEKASNPGSGAYGIPQALPGDKMASSGGDWQDNAATQIDWGLGYIKDRYQDPCGAWSFWQSNNHY